ncbi:MAG: GTP-binding protein [Candidatus Micrarchaeia archaeon]
MQIHRIALLGDKDHGKSTFVGNMLMLTKSISDARIEEAKRASRELGRAFEPGFLLDSFSEEREDAMTIDTTRAQIQYKGMGFELIDVPGHEELVSNMLTGASNASLGVLIVSAKKGEGISEQTKRHIVLSTMLGMDRLVVGVNKIDAISYRKEVFDAIKDELSSFIENIGKILGKVEVSFVPISAYNGDNLIRLSKNTKWYKGKPLVQILKNYAEQKDASARGLRATVQGAFEDGIACKIVSGEIKVNQEVVALPSGRHMKIEKIIKAGHDAKSASRGDSPILVLGDYTGIERGTIISAENDRPKVGSNVKALIFLVNIPKDPSIRIGLQEAKSGIIIDQELDLKSGNLAKCSKAKALGIYTANLKVDKKVVYEAFRDNPELGRFSIYDGREFAGLGIILK